MDISLIVAMAENGVIGRNNQLPWRLPADLQYFKRITLGKPIIMGRKTYESIGKPLPGRQNIVISHQTNLVLEGCDVVSSIQEALDCAGNAPEVMIIGGATIYEQALPIATKLYITKIHENIPGDTYFPSLDLSLWTEVSSQHQPKDDRNPHDYSFCICQKTNK